jgi:hypothetical protein
MRDIEKLIVKYKKKCKKSKTTQEKVENIIILEGLVKARSFITECALKKNGLN